MSRFGLQSRLTDQTDQPIHGILTVLILRAESPRMYDQNALFSHPASG
jgi:hypothetical protein